MACTLLTTGQPSNEIAKLFSNVVPDTPSSSNFHAKVAFLDLVRVVRNTCCPLLDPEIERKEEGLVPYCATKDAMGNNPGAMCPNFQPSEREIRLGSWNDNDTRILIDGAYFDGKEYERQMALERRQRR